MIYGTSLIHKFRIPVISRLYYSVGNSFMGRSEPTKFAINQCNATIVCVSAIIIIIIVIIIAITTNNTFYGQVTIDPINRSFEVVEVGSSPRWFINIYFYYHYIVGSLSIDPLFFIECAHTQQPQYVAVISLSVEDDSACRLNQPLLIMHFNSNTLSHLNCPNPSFPIWVYVPEYSKSLSARILFYAMGTINYTTKIFSIWFRLVVMGAVIIDMNDNDMKK